MTREEFERLALNLREAGYLRRPALEEGAAYRAGWEEGLFARLERTALDSETIVLFGGRVLLAFWRGHRDGESTREVLLLSETATKLRHVPARFVTGAGYYDIHNERGGKPCIPRQ